MQHRWGARGDSMTSVIAQHHMTAMLGGPRCCSPDRH